MTNCQKNPHNVTLIPICLNFDQSQCLQTPCKYQHKCEHCGANYLGKACSSPKWGMFTHSKPHPWTPIPSFKLEWELNNHAPKQNFCRAALSRLAAWLKHRLFWTTIFPLNEQPGFYILKAWCNWRFPSSRVWIKQNFCHLPLRISGLGLVPKHNRGLFITLHSTCSINDYIDPESFSLTYCTINDAYTYVIRIINKLGPMQFSVKLTWKMHSV